VAAGVAGVLRRDGREGEVVRRGVGEGVAVPERKWR
jgi:hypothetical protein